jgi:CRISPR-associated Csx2 family protein
MKKLITFLGTGPGKRDDNGKPSMDYRKTMYRFDDGYITEASAFFGYELFLKYKPAEFHIVGTLQSMWATLYLHVMLQHGIQENVYFDLWDELVSNIDNETLKDVLPKLEKKLSKVLKAKVVIHIVDLLENSKKMWGFFSHLQTIIKKDDDVYLDVTHGFRHIPIILMNAMTYLTTYRENVNVAGIFYGAFEAKTDPRDASEPAPVIDLSATWEMYKLFHAVRDFTEFGHGRDLADLIKPKNKELANSIESFHKAAQISYSKDYFTQLHILASKLKTQDMVPESLLPAKPIFEKWFEEQKSDEDWHRQILLSKWYYDRQLYQQAVTLLTEGLISYAMAKANYDYKAEKERIKFVKEKLFEDKDKYHYFGYKDITRLYLDIKNIRNKMNHGGFVKNVSPEFVGKTYKKLQELFASDIFNKLLNGDFCLKNKP